MLRNLFRRLRRPVDPAVIPDKGPQYACTVNWNDVSAHITRLSVQDEEFNASTRAIQAADAQMVAELDAAVTPDAVSRAHLGLHPSAVKAMIYFRLATMAKRGALPALPKEVMWDFAIHASHIATLIAMAAEINASEE